MCCGETKENGRAGVAGREQAGKEEKVKCRRGGRERRGAQERQRQRRRADAGLGSGACCLSLNCKYSSAKRLRVCAALQWCSTQAYRMNGQLTGSSILVLGQCFSNLKLGSLNQIILCCWADLCTLGFLAASLASCH